MRLNNVMQRNTIQTRQDSDKLTTMTITIASTTQYNYNIITIQLQYNCNTITRQLQYNHNTITIHLQFQCTPRIIRIPALFESG